MNIQTMRDRFKGNAAGLADGLSDGEIDAFLSRAYRFDIPSVVDGEISESTWTLTTVAAQQSYEYPGNVVAPREHAWIDDAGGSIPLNTTTNPVIFEEMYAYPSGDTGRPTAVLFYGRVAKLSPTPDAVYTLTIPVRGGPEDALTDGSIVENDTHAMACVHAGLVEFLTEVNADDLATVNGTAMQRYAERLMTLSSARSRSRIPRRSF